MDIALILADATSVVGIAKLAIQLGEDAAPFVEAAYNLMVNKTTLTDEERANLQTQEDALRAQLDTDSIPADQA